ncbi:PREDICTED: O-acyltransferase WSD1-like isoform X3 [Nicotiana attenuata]|uniref:O-acyltransferase WSD1-like isoform X3 n=1 Tax=Nicotiana attenuata TaxID=49451 RepID=UPI000904827E|nr:PREDICTED: O-acyltransferase WSD1-like isoform X3 [Nicotiana attenuata]
MERDENKMVLMEPVRTTKKLDENEEEPEALLMSPTSRMFHEPNYNVYTLAIMGWKIPLNVDAMKAEIQGKLLKHPRFSSLQTVNDVILGITQAALSRYIHRRYEIEGKRKFSPQKMRCRANVVVNLRPALGVQTVAEMIEKNAIVIQGNCFGFVIIPLSISQLDNPLDYVLKAKTTMDRKKHSLESRCTFYFSQLLIKLFGFEGATTLAARVLSQTTLIFSNVAGPPEEVSCSGHPLTFLAPTCYGQPTGLMVHGCSYAKKLTFAVAVDEGIIPDPNLESFRLIKEAALSKWRTKVD